MHTFIQRGTRIQTEIGTDERPEVVRWTTWDGGTLKQSYALISTEGTILVDPVRPLRPDKTLALPPSIFKQYTGHKYLAVICTTALHERNIYWFRESYGIPIYVPKEVASAFEGKPDQVYEDGDVLPAGVQALWIGAHQKGEMVLHWRTPGGAQILICGDAIYGQSSFGAFDGASETFWHQTGGIRLFSQGRVGESEMRGRYECLLDLEFERILNGHNPKPIDQQPKDALRKVLREGTYELHPNGGCTYLWLDLCWIKGKRNHTET